MKKIILLVTFFVFNSHAAEVCMDVPDAISAKRIDTNFDGSTTFFMPKVYVDGTYLPISVDKNTANGFCAISDMEYVSAGLLGSYFGRVVQLKPEGTYYTTVKYLRRITEKIVCR